MPKRQTEISFGSDAFLDVIANMVGILIILIVIAGVKAARTPVTATPQAMREQLAADPPPASPPPVSGRGSVEADDPPSLAAPPAKEVAKPETAATLPIEEPLPELLPAQPPADLVEKSRQLELLLSELEVERVQSSQAASAQRQSQRELEEQVAQAKQQANQAVAALRDRQEDLSRIEEQLLEKKRRFDALVVELESERNHPPPVESIEHRLTPIGRDVEGKEIHFRLANNRVSYVPVMELAAQVQRDIERHKDVLLSRSVFKGTVGPLEGYRMEYLIQRQAMSLVDELRYGRGVIRMIVTSWIIQPERYLVTESADEALRTNSRFVQAVQKAGPGTTITFWVYPDSFEIHRRLKEVAHETGFRVASRPLPEGVPIAGSPDGSKSVSQ